MHEQRKQSVPPFEAETLAYKIRNSLYLNITNRCTNVCIFCPKFKEYKLYGNDLLLKSEPSFEDVMDAIGEPVAIDEIVFCGFGESLLRLDLLVRIAKELKQRYTYRIRINTDGQANLVYGRNIIPDLAGLVDCISVSLNAPDPSTYIRLCNTPFGADGFKGVCDFIGAAKNLIPEVIATAVNVPGVDMEACRLLAESLGVAFRVRGFTNG